MSQRRLNHQQQRRIQARHQQRQNQTPDESLQGLQPERQGLVIRHHKYQVEVQDDSGLRQRCHLRQNLGQLVCGDEVLWQPGEPVGVVTALLPRRSLLSRPDPYQGLKPVAANIGQILIVCAPLPEFSERLLDRYLVAAELSGIDPVILLNKADLLDDCSGQQLETRLQPYQALGYHVLWLSSLAPDSLLQLDALLTQGISIFVGQSGVGKSSLINRLQSKQAEVGPVSTGSGLGQHTTTAAELYQLPQGGKLIDSPGIREFGLWHIGPRELEQGYREFLPFLGGCRFRDCDHVQSPGCALEAACQQGQIHPLRLDNFRHLLASLNDVSLRPTR